MIQVNKLRSSIIGIFIFFIIIIIIIIIIIKILGIILLTNVLPTKWKN